ncbi:MAG TPA: hypothetical protein VIL04_04415 [Solirubrobacterales bacterium]
MSELATIRSAGPAIALAVLALVGATLATGAMRSERLGPRLCETTGGGRFVSIPGSPGERIDRRLLNDVRMLKRKYKIFITDGYSLDPVHSRKGEHPIGLALDIVPDRSRGGNWRLITKLARWAEPRQNKPRPPFRWVGYNGDAGHGRGNHLHLSWSHSETRYNVPARTVYTVRCPTRRKPKGDDPKQPEKPKDGGQSGGGGSPSPSTGGISAVGFAPSPAPVGPETGGVSLHRRR